MWMKLDITSVVLASLLIVSGLSVRGEDAAVLGKIGGIEVRTSEVLSALDEKQKAAVASDPAAASQYVRALLVQKLVLEQAIQKDWDKQPAVIAKLVRLREEAIAESYLDSLSAPENGYPSETELKDAYEANKSRLVIPKAYRLAQIYIKLDPANESAGKKRLDEVTKQLAAKGADFSAIAAKTSDDAASAGKGGEIGWLSESQIQPGIVNEVTSLKTGVHSKPIRLPDGWHILKVLDVREPRTPALEEIRDELVTNLRAEKRRINRQKVLADLLKEHPPAINEIELMKLR
jgi:parvulin-like peptidyl-prolyl isomerase